MKKIDLHLHSDLSSDGKVTFAAIVKKLKQEGVQIAALTNHIPETPGHLWYASCDAIVNLKKERDKLEDAYGVRVLVGAEIDVIDVSGTLAAPESLIDEFEFIISGVHRYPNATRGRWFHGSRLPVPNADSAHYGPAQYYAISEGILRNEQVTVLAHPLFAYDFLFSPNKKAEAIRSFPEIYKREIMRIAAEEGKAIELNSDDIDKMDSAWFAFGKTYGTMYSIGSDAHSLDRVGDVKKSYDYVKKYEIPEEKIIHVG